MEHCRSKNHIDTLRCAAGGTWKVSAGDTSEVRDIHYCQPDSQGPFISSVSVPTDEHSGLVLSAEPKGVAAVALQNAAINSVAHRQAGG